MGTEESEPVRPGTEANYYADAAAELSRADVLRIGREIIETAQPEAMRLAGLRRLLVRHADFTDIDLIDVLPTKRTELRRFEDTDDRYGHDGGLANILVPRLVSRLGRIDTAEAIAASIDNPRVRYQAWSQIFREAPTPDRGVTMVNVVSEMERQPRDDEATEAARLLMYARFHRSSGGDLEEYATYEAQAARVIQFIDDDIQRALLLLEHSQHVSGSEPSKSSIRKAYEALSGKGMPGITDFNP